MSRHATLQSLQSDIASAIKAKSGRTDTILGEHMDGYVRALPNDIGPTVLPANLPVPQYNSRGVIKFSDVRTANNKYFIGEVPYSYNTTEPMNAKIWMSDDLINWTCIFSSRTQTAQDIFGAYDDYSYNDVFHVCYYNGEYVFYSTRNYAWRKRTGESTEEGQRSADTYVAYRTTDLQNFAPMTLDDFGFDMFDPNTPVVRNVYNKLNFVSVFVKNGYFVATAKYSHGGGWTTGSYSEDAYERYIVNCAQTARSFIRVYDSSDHVIEHMLTHWTSSSTNIRTYYHNSLWYLPISDHNTPIPSGNNRTFQQTHERASQYYVNNSAETPSTDCDYKLIQPYVNFDFSNNRITGVGVDMTPFTKNGERVYNNAYEWYPWGDNQHFATGYAVFDMNRNWVRNMVPGTNEYKAFSAFITFARAGFVGNKCYIQPKYILAEEVYGTYSAHQYDVLYETTNFTEVMRSSYQFRHFFEYDNRVLFYTLNVPFQLYGLPSFTHHTKLKPLFRDIAAAIRFKKGTTAQIKADDFDTEVASIQ